MWCILKHSTNVDISTERAHEHQWRSETVYRRLVSLGKMFLKRLETLLVRLADRWCHQSLVDRMALSFSVISVLFIGMTITKAEKFCLPQQSTDVIASAENTSDGSIWPPTWVCKVLTSESELTPSLTRARKKLNSQKNGSIVFLPGRFFCA